MFKVKVEGLGSFDKEVNELDIKISKAKYAGLKAVANDLGSSLYRHIEEDFYNQGEPPINYQRRRENGGMLDPQNISTDISSDYSLTFQYQFPIDPSNWARTPYRYYEWLNGDDAIAGIQDGVYPTIGAKGEPKPFWDKFVREEFTDGKAEDSFIKGMNSKYPELQVEPDRKITVEATDSIDLHDSLMGGQKVEMPDGVIAQSKPKQTKI